MSNRQRQDCVSSLRHHHRHYTFCFFNVNFSNEGGILKAACFVEFSTYDLSVKTLLFVSLITQVLIRPSQSFKSVEHRTR